MKRFLPKQFRKALNSLLCLASLGSASKINDLFFQSLGWSNVCPIHGIHNFRLFSLGVSSQSGLRSGSVMGDSNANVEAPFRFVGSPLAQSVCFAYRPTKRRLPANLAAERILQMDFLTKWIAISGFVLGSAVFFDRIASDEFKRYLAQIIKGMQPHLETDIPRFARFFIHHTIARFFPGEITGWRNIGKAALLSLASLAIFSALICYFYNLNFFSLMDFTSDLSLASKIAAFLLVLGSAIAVDIASSLQTALFIRLIARIRSPTDMLFMAACDLIVTINLFVFIFPIGLSAWVVGRDQIGRSVDLFIERPSVESTRERQLGDEVLSQAISGYGLYAAEVSAVTYLGSSADSSSRPAPATGTIVATKGVDGAKLVDSFLRQLGVNNPTEHKGSPPNYDDDDDLKELRDAIYSDKTFSHGVVHLARHLSLEGQSLVYGRIFNKLHVIQDNFPAVVKLVPVYANMNDIHMGWPNEFVRVPHDRARQYFVSCDGKDYFSDTIGDLQKCKTLGILASGRLLKTAYEFSYLMQPDLLAVPASLFIITSLFLTATFYICFALALIGAWLARRANVVAFSWQWLDYEKSPFAVIGLALVILTTPVILLGNLAMTQLLRQ
jgi:hypothetical protein